MKSVTRQREGFTLIELLVVIAIISILASILFPVFARAREKGRQTACLSNTRQIVMAARMYASDYDEILPWGSIAGQLWHETIYPYTRNRQIYVCPSRQDRVMGYAVNPFLSGTSEGTLFDPSVKIYVGDVPPEAIGATANSPGSEYWINDLNNDIGAPDDNSFGTCAEGPFPERHNDGLNWGYADGHSKWARESQVDQLYMWLPQLETP